MGLFERKPPPRERTTEERERARAERAARRDGHDGAPAADAVPPPLETEPPAAPAPAPPPAPAPDPAPAPAPVRHAAPTSAPQAPPVAPSLDGHVATDAGPVVGPRPVRRSAPAREDAPSALLDNAVAEDWSAVDAPPKVPLGERLRRRRAGAPPPGAAPQRRRPVPAVLLGVLGLGVAVVLAVVWFLLSLFQPLHGDGSGRVSVVIPRGATVSQAGDVLAKRGVVSSVFFFKLRAKFDGPGEIKPGTYRLPKDISYGAAFDALAAGPPKAKSTDITITEGRTIKEVNRLLKKTSLRGSYAAATRRSKVLRPRRYGAPRSVHSLEGFLFPATYQVRVGGPVSNLVTKQLQTFRKRFATVNLAYARSKKLTAYDVLVIASMIEREAAVAKDRKLIASVIYNRLHQSIPLGIDATIRYRLDNWTRPLRVSELQDAGPYNTRTHQGLPPTPIGNPGLASIRAAAHPAKTGYLFFVVKPCGRGEHAFQKTNAEFERAAQRYEQARQAKGGSPVDC